MYSAEISPNTSTITRTIGTRGPQQEQKRQPGQRTSVSYKYERLDISLEYTTYSVNKQPQKVQETKSPETNKTGFILNEKERIKDEILEQTKQLLKEFFDQNPEDLEDIQQGIIPEYFNVNNTARRILNIFFSKYEEEDVKLFAEHARTIINQAYNDVEKMAGALPDIVQQTKEKVLGMLEDFENGNDINDFLNG